MDKKLIVISIDAMVNEDLAIIRTLPNLGRVLSESCVVHKNLSTYPTMTHAVHTSIYTGCWPEHHGVPGNEQFLPGNLRSPWYEHYSWLRAPGLPERAKQLGMTAATVFWPLTLGAPDDFVLHRASIHHAVADEANVIKHRSTPGLVEALWDKIEHTFSMPHYEGADVRACECAAQLIRTRQPDVMYMHLILIDHVRHVGGVFGAHVEQGYRFLDAALAPVLTALEQTGLYDKTILAFTADHGQIDIDRVVAINRFFADAGLLSCDADGQLASWHAYAHGQGMSSHIYVRDHDLKFRVEVEKLLRDNREMLGIGEIMTLEEAKCNYHIAGMPDLVVDTDGHSSFTSKFAVPLYACVDDSDYRYSHATHGYLPQKGPQPLFFVRDPFSRRRVEIENARVIDQAPTLAQLLGFSMNDCDGTVLKELVSK